MSERHIIKISVELRSVKLLVRFPCKLTIQLKTGTAALTQTPRLPKQGIALSSREASASSIRPWKSNLRPSSMPKPDSMRISA